MCKKISSAAAYALSLFLMTALSHAEESFDQSEVKMIFTGNTVEGKIIKRDADYKMYLHPSGKLIRHDGEDNFEKGAWRISNDYELCLTFASEECHTVTKRGDDMYELRNPKGELEITIVKVTLGNPDKMKP